MNQKIGTRTEIVELMKNENFDWKWGLKSAFYSGNMEFTEIMLSKYNERYVFKDLDSYHFNWSLHDACRHGHILITYLIVYRRRYYDINSGLRGACEGGHMRLVKFMITCGANDWGYGLISACRGINREIANEIVLLMLEKGHNKNHIFNIFSKGIDTNYLKVAFSEACQYGNLEIIKTLTDLTEFDVKDFNAGLYKACVGGHKNLVDLMISNGANDWNIGLYGACIGGHVILAELMISNGAYNWNWGLKGARKNCHNDLIDLMISKGANPCYEIKMPTYDL
jgi:hypothetical protein